MKGWTQDLESVRANSNNENSPLQERDENTLTSENQLVEVMKLANIDWDWEHLKSSPNLFRKPRRAKNHLVFRVCVHKILKRLV